MAESIPSASSTTCCIAGVPTVVLEKHGDFLRDFRGDTVHPSTLRIMDELGLLDEFLQRPHQKLEVIGGWFGDQHVQLGDFRGLPARYAFIAMVPQWEFLDFIADQARPLPAFTLRMRAEVTGLVEDAQRRRMHRVAAEVAQEVAVLLEHDGAHAGTPQQVAEHHSGRAAAGDAALRRGRRIAAGRRHRMRRPNMRHCTRSRRRRRSARPRTENASRCVRPPNRAMS